MISGHFEAEIGTTFTPELGGHGHELNGHRCPCPRHGHGRGMDTIFLGKRGVDMNMVTKKSVKRGVDMDTEFSENRGVVMDMDTEFFENRGVDMDMDTAWNRCPPNSDYNKHNSN